jgi:DNA polymerase-3 subunit epsilon
MDNYIFTLTKYKNLLYKEVLQTHDDRYFKYLITNFKFLYNIIYDFYVYLRLNNKYVDEINKLLNIKILLDTETTGLFNYDSVLQLSYVIFNDSDLLKTFNKIIRINPKIKIKNSFIHGITQDHCKLGEPCNIVMSELHEDLKICKTIVGHKVDFDLRMLSNEFKRLNIEYSFLTHKIEDTMKLAQIKYKKKTKLTELYKLEFNTDMEHAHNAFYDVMATYKIYKNLVK